MSRLLPMLVCLNLGTLVNNGIIRVVSNTCPNLKEFRLFLYLLKLNNYTIKKNGRLINYL